MHLIGRCLELNQRAPQFAICGAQPTSACEAVIEVIVDNRVTSRSTVLLYYGATDTSDYVEFYCKASLQRPQHPPNDVASRVLRTLMAMVQ